MASKKSIILQTLIIVMAVILLGISELTDNYLLSSLVLLAYSIILFINPKWFIIQIKNRKTRMIYAIIFLIFSILDLMFLLFHLLR
jgi:hypothetical protein